MLATQIIDLLKAFTSTDPTREALTKPLTRGAYTAATNGHVLVRAELGLPEGPVLAPGEHPPAGSFPETASMWEDAVRFRKGDGVAIPYAMLDCKPTEVRIGKKTRTPGKVFVFTHDTVILADSLGARKFNRRFGLNPALLAPLAKLLKDNAFTLTIWPEDDSVAWPFEVRENGQLMFEGLVMPMRIAD